MECSFRNATFKGQKIIAVLRYTGDYVLFKTEDNKLHVEKKEYIELEK